MAHDKTSTEELIPNLIQDWLADARPADDRLQTDVLAQLAKQSVHELMIRAEDPWEGVMAAQQLMIELGKLIATRTADLVQG